MTSVKVSDIYAMQPNALVLSPNFNWDHHATEFIDKYATLFGVCCCSYDYTFVTLCIISVFIIFAL